MVKITKLLVSDSATVANLLATIEAGGQGIALVVDEQHRLLATLTDGDIRRAMLDGAQLSDGVAAILARRPTLSYESPVIASPETSPLDLLQLMNRHGLHQIPLVNAEGIVEDLAVLGELTKQLELPLTAVIMAGGYGMRLRPLTDNVPKPMLEVGKKPLLEVTVRRLSKSGIRRINLISHYRSDMIVEHFGNGNGFGVAIEHVREDEPMGTAGGLGLLDTPAQPLLVMNGDILTHMDFSALYKFHCERRSQLTVGVRSYEVQIPFGVVEESDSFVSRIVEKPIYRHLVNAGIYLLDPEVFKHLPKDPKFDMTDVISRAIENGLRVVPFEIQDYWMDIGSLKDYEQAQRDNAHAEGD